MKYARLRKGKVVEILDYPSGTKLSDVLPKKNITLDEAEENGIIGISEYEGAMNTITIGTTRKNKKWISPQPNETYEWNDNIQQWVYNKKLDKPMGNNHIWDENIKDWIRIRYSSSEFYNLLTVDEKIAIKSAITKGNTVVLFIDEFIKSFDTIDIRDSQIKDQILRLTTNTGGNILTKDRYNFIFKF